MYNKLCLSGGSIKGMMYTGMLKYFEENEIILEYLNEVVGTSVGALASLLIVLGYTSNELVELFMSINFEGLKDVSLEYLETGFGFDNGGKINELIKTLIMRKGFNPEITFIELYHKTKIILACSSYNVSKKQGVFFDHISHPNMPVYLATRCSMNLPIIFCAVNYDNDYYVDGGLVCNLPIKYISNKYDKNEIKKTLSIVFDEINYSTSNSISNIEEYLYNLYKSTFNYIETLDKKFIIDNGYDLITLKTTHSTSSSFHLNEKQKKELFDQGYLQTKTYFELK